MYFVFQNPRDSLSDVESGQHVITLDYGRSISIGLAWCISVYIYDISLCMHQNKRIVPPGVVHWWASSNEKRHENSSRPAILNLSSQVFSAFMIAYRLYQHHRWIKVERNTHYVMKPRIKEIYTKWWTSDGQQELKHCDSHRISTTQKCSDRSIVFLEMGATDEGVQVIFQMW